MGHQKSAAQRWNRHPFAQFLHFLQKDPCFVSGRKGAGLDFSILLVVSMRGLEKPLCSFSNVLCYSPQVLKNQQTAVIKLFAELPEPHLFVSESKLACSESKVGPIKNKSAWNQNYSRPNASIVCQSIKMLKRANCQPRWIF